MNDLERALADLQAIKQQMSKSITFRGFGCEVLCLTAAMAILAGLFQGRVVDVGDAMSFTVYWLAVATVASAAIMTEAVRRAKSLHQDTAEAILWAGLWQVLPPLFVGLALAVILASRAPEVVWLLPGLWQVLIAIAVFSVLPSLPVGMRLVGGWYLLSGFACIVLAGRGVPSALFMAMPFAVGQGLGAVVLGWTQREQANG